VLGVARGALPERFEVTAVTGGTDRRTYLKVMGVLEWITGRVGRDLDRRVSGAEGTAQGHFQRLVDDEALTLHARLGDGQRGTLVVRAPGREERGEGSLSIDLGEGRPLRGKTLVIEADVAAPGLAALIVALSQPHGSDTFSVEGRPDQSGHARLHLSVLLG
jgi:hypothetical protein